MSGLVIAVLQWDSAFDRHEPKPVASVHASSKAPELVTSSAAVAVAPAVVVASTAAAPATASPFVTPGAPAADGKGGKKKACSVL